MLDILGVKEIAELLGEDRDTISMRISRGKLPAPDAYIGGGWTKVWRRSTIERWIQQEQR